jgi:hypothetical protein
MLQPESNKIKRPRSVTFLVIGVLSLTGIFITRFIQTIIQWEFLATLPLSVSPLYLALTGFGWGLIGLSLGLGLWFGWRYARRGLQIALPVFVVYDWIDLIFLVESPGGKASIPFRLGITIVFALMTYWILSRQGVKTFFGEVND